jgi:carbon storage regulator
MLVLSRKVGERLMIGDAIEVTVEAVRGGSVRLGIVAPVEIPVLREELTWSNADDPLAAKPRRTVAG